MHGFLGKCEEKKGLQISIIEQGVLTPGVSLNVHIFDILKHNAYKNVSFDKQKCLESQFLIQKQWKRIGETLQSRVYYKKCNGMLFW